LALSFDTGIEMVVPVESLSRQASDRLVAQRLISPGFAAGGVHRLVLLDGARARSIMVNEEDHFRIQTLLPGWQPERVWEMSASVAMHLESMAPVAFGWPFGYLTASPLNVGTGLRLSAMMHLPALAQLGRMFPIAQAAGEIGVEVRGLFGEGSEALGDLLQISNALTLGISEEEILRRVKAVVFQVISQERQARREILYRWERPLRESIEWARSVLPERMANGSRKVWKALSLIRLGIGLGLASDLTLERWNHWLVGLRADCYDMENGVVADNLK